jgi:hypothetical protein
MPSSNATKKRRRKKKKKEKALQQHSLKPKTLQQGTNAIQETKKCLRM